MELLVTYIIKFTIVSMIVVLLDYTWEKLWDNKALLIVAIFIFTVSEIFK